MERSYHYVYESNDDDTSAYIKVEVEVFAANRRSAVARIHKAIASLAGNAGISRDDIAQDLQVEE